MALKNEGDFVRGPARVAEIMRGFPGPWYIAGGWAIDLYLDRLTRPHADIEIAIDRRDQSHLYRHLTGWRLQLAQGGQLRPWVGGQWLAPPLHEIHAERDASHSATEITHLEILLNEFDDGVWKFRRNHLIELEPEYVGFESEAGLPTLIPEVVLLYKAKGQRPRDEEDFDNVLAVLEPEGRAWLRWALGVAHTGHPWIDRIAAADDPR